MYYSQYQQDKFIDKVIFAGKKNGFFVDIGAYDGITINNTIFFEKFRNWTGLCIEPNPKVFPQLKRSRSCKVFNCCIGDFTGVSVFLHVTGESEMLSGLKNSYDPRHIDRIEREVLKNDGKIREISVEVKPLSYFLNIEQKIDFLSIDTEGNEFEILKTIDFSKIEIYSISIENNYKNSEIEDYLSTKGFLKICSLVCDEIYVDKSIINLSMKLRLFLWKINTRIALHKKGLKKRLGFS
ncbi:FkbM family methyltransferase [Algoriphagus persicinus]|uniref:FkbM family methyltransferase n=1 Tax=Algoriphagus persicinus TaxID=3108754 RepID=UPI002B39B841|nr:FkbM family methyltransferase [Algoriphagus sp. E1-3-M2]MEB2784737.1 FkbM family methyltransferase [Algoriphagus sp. E1-3-M2]